MAHRHGSEGGVGGGMVVGMDTPKDIAANPDRYTGRYLARLLRWLPSGD